MELGTMRSVNNATVIVLFNPYHALEPVFMNDKHHLEEGIWSGTGVHRRLTVCWWQIQLAHLSSRNTCSQLYYTFGVNRVNTTSVQSTDRRARSLSLSLTRKHAHDLQNWSQLWDGKSFTCRWETVSSSNKWPQESCGYTDWLNQVCWVYIKIQWKWCHQISEASGQSNQWTTMEPTKTSKTWHRGRWYKWRCSSQCT